MARQSSKQAQAQCHVFPTFFIQTKNQPRCSIYHAVFGKYAKFHKNLLQTHENMGPQACQFIFLQRNVCQGATCPLPPAYISTPAPLVNFHNLSKSVQLCVLLRAKCSINTELCKHFNPFSARTFC